MNEITKISVVTNLLKFLLLVGFVLALIDFMQPESLVANTVEGIAILLSGWIIISLALMLDLSKFLVDSILNLELNVDDLSQLLFSYLSLLLEGLLILLVYSIGNLPSFFLMILQFPFDFFEGLLGGVDTIYLEASIWGSGVKFGFHPFDIFIHSKATLKIPLPIIDDLKFSFDIGFALFPHESYSGLSAWIDLSNNYLGKAGVDFSFLDTVSGLLEEVGLREPIEWFRDVLKLL